MDSKRAARKSYYQARKENIKEHVSCADILEHYGVDLLYENTEVQYRCPLHGDGRDMKKSARYYPHSDSTYCWGCHEYRDHIGLVMDFEGCSFTEALSILEKKWNIEDVPDIYEFSDPDPDQKKKFQSSLENELDNILDQSNDATDQKFSALERKIDRFVEEYRFEIDCETALKLYHAYDHLIFRFKNDKISLEKALKTQERLSSKIQNLEDHVSSN